MCDRWSQRSAPDLQLPGFAISCLFLQGQERGTQRILPQKTAWPKRPPSGGESILPDNSLFWRFSLVNFGLDEKIKLGVRFNMKLEPVESISSSESLQESKWYTLSGVVCWIPLWILVFSCRCMHPWYQDHQSSHVNRYHLDNITIRFIPSDLLKVLCVRPQFYFKTFKKRANISS